MEVGEELRSLNNRVAVGQENGASLYLVAVEYVQLIVKSSAVFFQTFRASGVRILRRNIAWM